MLRSVDLSVALDTHLEQLVAAQVKAVVRLCLLEVGLLGAGETVCHQQTYFSSGYVLL